MKNHLLISVALAVVSTQLATPQTPHSAPPGITTPGIQIPLAKLKPDAIIPVPGAPDWIAVGEDVWVSNRPKSNVSRIDPGSNSVKQVVSDLPGACSGLAIGFGSLWVPTCQDQALARVDLASGKITARIPTGIANSEGGVTVGAGSVWLMSDKSSKLSRFDPQTNKLAAQMSLPPGCYSVAFGFASVWATCTEQNSVVRIDPSTNSIVTTIPTGPQPRFLTVGEGAVWTLNQGDGSITRIDPERNKIAATIQVGIPGEGGDITAGEGFVWATLFGVPLSRIDPSTNMVVQQFVGAGGDALRVANGSVWLSNYKSGTEWHMDPKKIIAIKP